MDITGVHEILGSPNIKDKDVLSLFSLFPTEDIVKNDSNDTTCLSLLTWLGGTLYPYDNAVYIDLKKSRFKNHHCRNCLSFCQFSNFRIRFAIMFHLELLSQTCYTSLRASMEANLLALITEQEGI